MSHACALLVLPTCAVWCCSECGSEEEGPLLPTTTVEGPKPHTHPTLPHHRRSLRPHTCTTPTYTIYTISRLQKHITNHYHSSEEREIRGVTPGLSTLLVMKSPPVPFWEAANACACVYHTHPSITHASHTVRHQGGVLIQAHKPFPRPFPIILRYTQPPSY